MTEARVISQNAPRIVIGGETSLAEPIGDITFAVQPVRRPQSDSRRRKKPKRHALLDDDLSAAASMLADPAATSADVAGACEGVMAALSRQTSSEAYAASATILPGLSVHQALLFQYAVLWQRSRITPMRPHSLSWLTTGSWVFL